MGEFLNALPEAAKSPLAIAAFCVCAVLAIYGGLRLKLVKAVLQRSRAGGNEPSPAELRKWIELTTETKLPSRIDGEQWVRLKKIQAVVAIVLAGLITVVAVVALARESQVVPTHDPPRRGTLTSPSDPESPLRPPAPNPPAPEPRPAAKQWFTTNEAGDPYLESFGYTGPDCHEKPARVVEKTFTLSRLDARIDSVECHGKSGPTNFDYNPVPGRAQYEPFIEISADKRSFLIKRHHTSAPTRYEYVVHYSVLR